jgi:cytochrome bd-type quinol oxidase subunit 1
MRFYIKDAERKPDPAPIKASARLAVMVGLVLWVLALAACLLNLEALAAAQKSWWLATCIFGIILGIFAFFKVRNR